MTSPDNNSFVGPKLLIFWHDKLQVSVWCDEFRFAVVYFLWIFILSFLWLLYIVLPKATDLLIVKSYTVYVWIVFIPKSLGSTFIFPSFRVFLFCFLKIIYYISFVFYLWKSCPFFLIFYFCWTGRRSPEISAIKLILLCFIYSN